jgi:hypothetical protein
MIYRRCIERALTSLAHDPAIRKFPGKVGGLKDRQPILSSGEDVTSISWEGKVIIKMYILPRCQNLSQEPSPNDVSLSQELTGFDLSLL